MPGLCIKCPSLTGTAAGAEGQPQGRDDRWRRNLRPSNRQALPRPERLSQSSPLATARPSASRRLRPGRFVMVAWWMILQPLSLSVTRLPGIDAHTVGSFWRGGLRMTMVISSVQKWRSVRDRESSRVPGLAASTRTSNGTAGSISAGGGACADR